MTDSMFAVAADLVAELRDGLLTELGLAATLVGELTEQIVNEAPPEAYRPLLKQFHEAQAALEAIMWGVADPPVAVEVDLAVHGSICLKVLEGQERSYIERMDEIRAKDKHAAIKRLRRLESLVRAVEHRMRHQGDDTRVQ